MLCNHFPGGKDLYILTDPTDWKFFPLDQNLSFVIESMKSHNSPSFKNCIMNMPENKGHSLFFWFYGMRSKQFSFIKEASEGCFCKTALIWNTFHSYLNGPKDHSNTAQWRQLFSNFQKVTGNFPLLIIPYLYPETNMTDGTTK